VVLEIHLLQLRRKAIRVEQIQLLIAVLEVGVLLLLAQIHLVQVAATEVQEQHLPLVEHLPHTLAVVEVVEII
jgi:hypothetical protein